MTIKRALARGESASAKVSRDDSSKKRRKLAHDGVETTSPSRSGQTPTKNGGKRSKSKGQEAEVTPTKSLNASGRLPVESGELVPVQDAQQEEQPAIEPTSSANWSISRCRSGRFLNLDPIFAADGRYVILATEDEVQVFSLSTSRVVRTLPTHGSWRLSGCKLSPSNPELLFGSTVSGGVYCWNWESGKELKSFEKQHSIVTIDVAGESSTTSDTFLFALCIDGNGHREISVDVMSEDAENSQSTVVRKSSTPFKDIRVAAGGKVVLAWSDNRLLVGYTANALSRSSIESVQYTWREVRVPVCATCIDVQVTPPPPTERTSKKAGSFMKVDVVLGESGGSILIYNDILNRLVQSENPEAANDLISNRMHWHRKAVKAVRWSKDGNYIISGGLETVLVLWQLDTGRKQFLPHLSSPICNIVVSPIGNAYAIKLADNSVMVLSTSELKPVASMSGLQLPLREDILGRPAEAKEGKPESDIVDPQIPAILHPIQPDRLLLAVPSTQLLSDMDSPPTASHLQAFDIRSGQHISRQTLTRTNVSVLNTGPQGNELTAPDVKLVNISADGDWLATVDEWTQYPEDNKVLRPRAESENRDFNREVFLKFWHWEESVREWQLVTRVDAPHFKASSRSSRVLDIAVQPEELGFATIGGDGVVRLWAPDRQTSGRKRIRTWRCSGTVVLEKQPQMAKKGGDACLSFSNDGSILAACWPGSSEMESSLVHLIDPTTGNIRCSRDGLFAGTPRGIGFLDRYLIILSDRLVIWDIVSDEIKSMLRFDGKQSKSTSTHSFLAMNPRSQTFAVAFTSSSSSSSQAATGAAAERGRWESQLAIFEPSSPCPVFQSSLKISPRALLPDLRTGEYVIIDRAAQVQRIGSGDRTRLPMMEHDSDLAMPVGLGNTFGGGSASQQEELAGPPTGTTGAVVDNKSLAGIFDVGPSFALPSVDVLFKNVVDLFSGGTSKA